MARVQRVQDVTSFVALCVTRGGVETCEGCYNIGGSWRHVKVVTTVTSHGDTVGRPAMRATEAVQ
jgi:hypothetical protein